MFCKNCGFSNSDNSAFCINCGEKMMPASQVQEQQPQENQTPTQPQEVQPQPQPVQPQPVQPVQPQPVQPQPVQPQPQPQEVQPQPQPVQPQPQPVQPQPQEVQPQPQPVQPQEPVYEMQEAVQPPKKKNVLKIVIPAVLIVVVLAAGIGAGIYVLKNKGSDKKDSGDNKAAEAVADVSDKGNSSVDDDGKSEEETTKKKTDSKKEVVEVEVTAGSGRDFSDGKAWIQTKDDSQWMCIDTEGNILFTLDECYSSTDFVNGYSIINNSYIIDEEGNHVLDFEDDDYELYSDAALDVSCVLLSKYVDTYEISGTILYVANLESGDITECDMSGAESADDYNQYTSYTYMGSGYYYPNNNGTDTGKLELYDSVNNKIVSVSVADNTSSSSYYYMSDVQRIGDGTMLRLMMNSTLYIIDTATLEVKKKLDDVSTWDVKCYGEELIGYSTATYSEKNTWYYDIGTDELFQLTTSYDEKGYSVLDYENEYFLISTYNDVGSAYIALLDKTGKTIIEPAKFGDSYYFEPKLHDGYFTYYCDGKLYFADAANPEDVKSVDIAGSDNGSISYIAVQDTGSVFVKFSNNFNYAYTKEGDVIFENKNYTITDKDIQDGYRLIQNTENNTAEYWDESNQKLKVVKSEVFDPDDYKAAYRKALEKSTITWGSVNGGAVDSSDISFELVDLDNDGSEEILLNNSYASHADGYQALAYNDNGEMKYIETTDSFTGYYPKHAVVVSNFGNMGYFTTAYCKYEDGELELLCSVMEDDNQEEVVYSYSDGDGKEITEEEYDELLKEAVGKEEMTKFNSSDLKENTKENREQYLN